MSSYLEPAIDDESRPFWEGLERGALVLPVCLACSRPHFYPRILCPHCGADELRWDEMSGDGVVYSVTVVHRRDKDGVPFDQTIALVTLDEGPRIMSEIRGGTVAIGDRVRLAASGEPALPFFAPAVEAVR